MSNFAFYFHDELDPVKFETELLWFKDRYNIISYNTFLEFLYDGRKIKNSCLLTIDDGWLSTYRVVFPIIKKYEIPITIFVSPDVCTNEWNFWYKEIQFFEESVFKDFLIKNRFFKNGIEPFPLEFILKELPVETIYQIITDFKKEYNIKKSGREFINVSELLEMSDSGLVEIGAHTITHPILANETAIKAENEIERSISELAKLCNKEISAFAYPNGLYGLDFGEREMEIVKKCGIKTAFSVNPGYINKKVNPYNIPRIGSMSRLKIPFGIYLPSRVRQAHHREQIRKNLLLR